MEFRLRIWVIDTFANFVSPYIPLQPVRGCSPSNFDMTARIDTLQ